MENSKITGERLQHLRLCSALLTFEQGGILLESHVIKHGPGVAVLSEGSLHSVILFD